MNLHQSVHCVGITLIYTLTTITLVKENFNMGICQQGPKSSHEVCFPTTICKIASCLFLSSSLGK